MKQQVWVRLFALFALWMILAAAWGALRGYSPFPAWDMWDSSVNFYMKFRSGDWISLWVPHYEHRVVLSKLLFLGDYACFGGRNRSLILENLLIGAGAAATLWFLLRDSVVEWGWEDTAMACFLAGWVFQWCQFENFARPDGSAQLAAPWVALLAFYWLFRAARGGWGPFAVACGFGVAAIGVLGSGVLVLPTMVVAAWVMGLGPRKAAILAALGLASILAYLHGWSHPLQIAPLALLSRPLTLVLYELNFMSGSFYYIFHQIKGVPVDAAAAILAGAGMIVFAVALAWRLRRAGPLRALTAATLFYLCYFAATACLIAVGRMAYTDYLYPASRYTTGGILAWGMVFVLIHANLRRAGRGRPMTVWLSALLLLAALAAREQRRAFAVPVQENERYGAAALAAGLNVDDPPMVLGSCWTPARIRGIAVRAMAQGVAIYGSPPWRCLPAEVGGSTGADPAAVPCRVDETVRLGGASGYDRVSGWSERPLPWVPGDLGRLRDRSGVVVGFAVPFAAPAGHGPMPGSYFVGYARRGSAPASLDPAGS